MTIESEIGHIAANPWLYDETFTNEERMFWKLKNVCHKCGTDPAYHKDDCQYSMPQLMLLGLTTGYFNLDTRNYTITKNKNV